LKIFNKNNKTENTSHDKSNSNAETCVLSDDDDEIEFVSENKNNSDTKDKNSTSELNENGKQLSQDSLEKDLND